jgi:hypothetical protein
MRTSTHNPAPVLPIPAEESRLNRTAYIGDNRWSFAQEKLWRFQERCPRTLDGNARACGKNVK